MSKIALLSNVNIDPLKNHIEKDFDEVYLSGFNQWQTDLLNPTSKLYGFQPDYIFIYLYAEESNFVVKDMLSAIDFYNSRQPFTQFIISNFSFAPFSAESYVSETPTRSKI